MKTIKQMMDELNADGVDFFDLYFGDEIQFPIRSYPKEIFTDKTHYPKSPYKFYKLNNGQKEYIE